MPSIPPTDHAEDSAALVAMIDLAIGTQGTPALSALEPDLQWAYLGVMMQLALCVHHATEIQQGRSSHNAPEAQGCPEQGKARTAGRKPS